MNTTTAHDPEIVAIPATSSGALDGFEAICECGLDIRNTIRSNVELEIREHRAYMAKKAQWR